eukprot:g11340.t1
MTPPAAGEAADVEQASGAPSTTPMSAAISSEPDLVVPPPLASEGEEGDLGGANAKATETRGGVVDTFDVACVTAKEEAPRVEVALERRTAGGMVLPGNNHLVNAWRPSDPPPEAGRGIEFNGWLPTDVSGEVPPHAGEGGHSKGQRRTSSPQRSIIRAKKNPPSAATRAKGAVSSRRKQRPDGRRPRLGVSGGGGNGKPGEVLLSPSATTTALCSKDGKPTTPRRRRGKVASRRPWGAGPGLTTAASTTSRDSSQPRPKASWMGGKAYDGPRHPDGKPFSRGSTRGRPSSRPPLFRSAAPKETIPLGPSLLEQFLPTWTSLVAEAAWLRSVEVTASGAGGGMAQGGGERGVGSVRSGGGGRYGGCGGGGCDGQRNDYGDVIGGSAYPVQKGERFADAVSTSGFLRGRSAEEHPRPTTTMSGGVSAVETGPSHQGGVGGGLSFNSKGREARGSHQGCNVPAPSLDPGVEGALMAWLKSRIDRNGRLTAPALRYSSEAAARSDIEGHCCREDGEHRRDGVRHGNGSGCGPPSPPLAQRNRRGDRVEGQQEEWHHHQRGERRSSSSSSVATQRPAQQGREAATSGLVEMFEQAVDDLLQKENMVPATGTASGTVDRGRRDRLPPGEGIGWVEVVRRVSEIAEKEQRGPEGLTATTTGQQPRHLTVQQEHARAGPTTNADQTDGTPLVDGGGRGQQSPEHGTNTNTNPTTKYPATNSSTGGPATERPGLHRPPPISTDPDAYGRHRPLSPPPRLSTLAEAPRSPLSPPTSPLPLPRALTASTPRRPTAMAAATESGFPPPPAPASPRASRWLLESNNTDGGGRPSRRYGGGDVKPCNGLVSREPDGGAGVGRSRGRGGDASGEVAGSAESESAARPAPPYSELSSYDAVGRRDGASRESAGEVGEEAFRAIPGGDDGSVSPKDVAKATYRGTSTRRTGGEERGNMLALEEYESDFEDEEN